MADPWPEGLAHCAEAHFLAAVQEINDRAIVPILPHREVNIMLLAVALDHNLVSTESHHRAPAQAIALVDLIAQAGGELAHFFFPYCPLPFCPPATPADGSNHPASAPRRLRRFPLATRSGSTLAHIMRRC